MKYRLLIVAATVIWGSSFVIVKGATDSISPAWLLVVRFFAAALILAVVFLKKRDLYFKREYLMYGGLFGLALFCAYYTQTIGITDTTPGKNAFLTAPYCVIVPFMAWFALKKKPGFANIGAAVLCLVGIGFVSLDSDLTIRFGDIMTLVGAFFYAVHITLVSKFTQGRDVYVLTMWQFAGVGVCSLVAALLFEQPPAFAQMPMSTLAGIAYLAVFCTAVALLFQNVGQKHLPPSSASLLLSLEAVFGVAFSVAVGAEVLEARIVFGFVLIFVAILISEVLPELRRKQS